MSRKRKTRRRFQFEGLEARQLMAADLYLDFGAAFNLDSRTGQHTFEIDMADATDSRNQAATHVAVPSELTSLADGVIARGIDYDQDGFVNYLDANAIAEDVADMIRRVYEPFAVNVHIVGSSNMNQVFDKLDDHSTNDAYILVGGRSEEAGTYGAAPVNIGNTRDDVGFAFAEDLLDKGVAAGPGENPWAFIVPALARTTAHEAAHSFGLRHLLDTTEGLTEDQLKLSASDLMDESDDRRWEYMSLATRWDGLPTDNGTQNAFQVLADNIGLKANGPAYVTGTGASDTILIEGIGNNQAQVTVSAFRDAEHTDLIETQSYVISTANGIIVEAGRRADRVEVLNVAASVTLRGGQGADELIGSNGNDILEGDTGEDDLLGGGGSDTYLFRGPRYQFYSRDEINDTSGTDDVLDFSALDFAINVNLASASDQKIERAPTQSFFINGQWVEISSVVPHASRLDLDLKSGASSGSTGIENVRGTRFNDRIYGNELDNELFGNAGADWLYGYDGLDILTGGEGDDILRGGDKRDLLYGQSGRDQLFGELGDDYLEGGYDGFTDVLNGGDGTDEFVQYFKTVLSGGTFTNPVGQTTQIVEGESLADFSSTRDKKIKKIVFPGFYTPFIS